LQNAKPFSTIPVQKKRISNCFTGYSFETSEMHLSYKNITCNCLFPFCQQYYRQTAMQLSSHTGCCGHCGVCFDYFNATKLFRRRDHRKTSLGETRLHLQISNQILVSLTVSGLSVQWNQ